jgi:hypothetical protein
VRGMRAQEATLAGIDPTLRTLWDDCLARIEATSSDRTRARDGTATPVAAPLRHDAAGHAGEPADVDLVDRYRAELLRDADPSTPELLELHYEQDVIHSVTAPAWADWLRPEDWVGTGLEQTMTVFATSAGTTMRSEVVPLGAGVHRAHLAFGTDGTTRLDAVLVPAGPGSTRSHLLVARLDGPDRSDRRSA